LHHIVDWVWVWVLCCIVGWVWVLCCQLGMGVVLHHQPGMGVVSRCQLGVALCCQLGVGIMLCLQQHVCAYVKVVGSLESPALPAVDCRVKTCIPECLSHRRQGTCLHSVLQLSVWLTLLLTLSIILVAGPTCNLISDILVLNINVVHKKKYLDAGK
jgi:hypothetical protein